MIFNNSKDILKQIRHIMLDQDISITELAKKMNKSRSAVSAVLKQSNISFNMLIDICNTLDLKLDITFIDSTDSAGGRETERED